MITLALSDHHPTLFSLPIYFFFTFKCQPVPRRCKKEGVSRGGAWRRGAPLGRTVTPGTPRGRGPRDETCKDPSRNPSGSPRLHPPGLFPMWVRAGWSKRSHRPHKTSNTGLRQLGLRAGPHPQPHPTKTRQAELPKLPPPTSALQTPRTLPCLWEGPPMLFREGPEASGR